MEQIVILKKETFEHLQKTIDQCRDWLATDTAYSHSNSKIRMVQINIVNLVRMMNSDLDQFRDNKQILENMLNKLNTANENKVPMSDVSQNSMLGGE